MCTSENVRGIQVTYTSRQSVSENVPVGANIPGNISKAACSSDRCEEDNIWLRRASARVEKAFACDEEMIQS